MRDRMQISEEFKVFEIECCLYYLNIYKDICGYVHVYDVMYTCGIYLLEWFHVYMLTPLHVYIFRSRGFEPKQLEPKATEA